MSAARTLPAEQAPVLTIDGPSGAGKGTVAARVAERLGWHLLDSGAVYRAMALKALEAGVAAEDEAGLLRLAAAMELDFRTTPRGVEVVLDGKARGAALRSEEVSQMASKVAVQPALRAALLETQRQLRRPPGLVADGRDMGTVVFPEASCKVFLDASIEERARRRHEQLKQQGENVIFDRLFRDLDERDRRDRERAVAPTVPAADAQVVDSTDLTIDQVVERVLKLVSERLRETEEK